MEPDKIFNDESKTLDCELKEIISEYDKNRFVRAPDKIDEIFYVTIENGINSTYITSILLSLFTKDSNIDTLLENNTNDPTFVYLQELIKNKFVNPLKKFYSISSNVINEIRNFSYICGWKNDSIILENHNAEDFLLFLMEHLNCNDTDFLHSQNGIIKLNVKSFAKCESDILNVMYMLRLWEKNFFENKSTPLFENVKEKSPLEQIPNLIPIFLDRKMIQKKYEKNKLNRVKNDDLTECHLYNKIDIPQEIRFRYIGDDTNKKLRWKIHAIVCCTYTSTNKKYYTLVNYKKNGWIVINFGDVPSIQKIDMNNVIIMEKIMRECVLIFYNLL